MSPKTKRPRHLADLERRQLSAKLNPDARLRSVEAPAEGWIKTIRLALGMTAAQLGKRLGMSPQAVLDIQRREVTESITLGTLKKTAAALDCDVRVVFVPRQGLDETARHMAAENAEEERDRITRTIGLGAKAGRPPDAPLQPGETAALLPEHVRTAGELDQWESANIARAVEWGYARMRRDILSVATLQALHRRMFGETWTSAGTFRRGGSAISPYHWPQVGVMMLELIDDTRSRHDASHKTPAELDDIALAFHHRLLRIQPWPTGNGRHARLATDLLLREWKRPPFTWGSAGGAETGEEIRRRYVDALRAADAGDSDALRTFLRG